MKKQPVKEEVLLKEQNQELIEGINQKVREFNLVRTGFEEETRKLEESYQQKFLDNQNKLQNITDEINVLEKRREKALEPLNQKRLELEERELSLSQLEIENYSQTLQIRTQISDLEAQKSKLLEEKDELRRLQSELFERRNRLKLELRQFDEQRRNWEIQQGKEWQEIETEKIQVERLSLEVKAKEEINQKITDNFKFQQEQINRDRKHLESQQQALRTAFEELRKKQYGDE